MTTYGKKFKTTVILFYLLYSHDTLPRSNSSASSWLPEAGAACTLKSWQEKESNFLSMKNVVSSKLLTNCQKRANEMQQRNLVFLRLPCVVFSHNGKQSWLAVLETENKCARGKRLWLKPPSSSGLIMPGHVMPTGWGKSQKNYKKIAKLSVSLLYSHVINIQMSIRW